MALYGLNAEMATRMIKKNSLTVYWIFCLLVISSQRLVSASDAVEYRIPMEDGVRLATDVYLPEANGKVSCILMRTPYNKDSCKGEAQWFVDKGLAVVVQDCRGKFQSEGEFLPFENERKDGLVTSSWIRQQEWSNQKIGGWGGSYLGYAQWAISDRLDAMTPHLTSANMYGLTYPGGLFSLATVINWSFIIDAREMNEIAPEKMKNSYEILPLSQSDNQTYENNRFYDNILKNSGYTEYWKLLNRRGSTESPVFSVAGWYDIFLTEQIKDFQAIAYNGNTDCHFVIWPRGHGKSGMENAYGGIERTGEPGNLLKNFMLCQMGVETKQAVMPKPFHDKKYNLFIMERNEYYGADQWPPKATKFTKYFLGSDRYMAMSMPEKNGQAGYTYDPLDPFPSLGGTLLGGSVGPMLQNSNLKRKDYIAFAMDIKDEPLILLGPIAAELYLASDLSCTDFIVCLQDVFPNGDIINIQEGGKRVFFEGGKVKKVSIPVWPTGYQVDVGHKLRVIVTSSLFPRYNRNLNTGEPLYTADKTRKAKQKMFWGADKASCLILPVLEL